MNYNLTTTKFDNLCCKIFYVTVSVIFKSLSNYFFHIHIFCFIEGRVKGQMSSACMNYESLAWRLIVIQVLQSHIKCGGFLDSI